MPWFTPGNFISTRERTLPQIVDRVLADVDHKGLDVLTPYRVGDLAAFRRFELAAAFNRVRALAVRGER